MEFLLTEISNGLMHKLKEFERPLFEMSMEIGRVKIGRSSGNHGTVTKLASASSRGAGLSTVECLLCDMNFIPGKTGGKTRICSGAVACEDCRLSNACCGT
jgi:hypothetical protein